MWNEPDKERLATIPGLYATEGTPLEDKVVYLHFFFAGCDWYVCEYDGKDTFFGYAILNDDLEMAEWGYVSLSELREVRISGMEVDCELEEYWHCPKASEVRKICSGMCWTKPNMRGGNDDQGTARRTDASSAL